MQTESKGGGELGRDSLNFGQACVEQGADSGGQCHHADIETWTGVKL